MVSMAFMVAGYTFYNHSLNNYLLMKKITIPTMDGYPLCLKRIFVFAFQLASFAFITQMGFSQCPMGTVDYSGFPSGTDVNGLTIMDVTYAFDMPDNPATIAGGPPPQTFVSPPCIEGPGTGMLTLNFSQPVTDITYGFAVLSPGIPDATTLTVYDAGDNVVGIFSEDGVINTSFPFPEGQLVANFPAAVKAEITWNPLISRFFFDNLTITCGISPTISQTDEDGDGTPDITDPCACGDPLNIIDGMGQITHFHDFVLVNSGPGETWQVTALNSGAIFDNGLAAIPLNTPLVEISPGVYRLDLWHPVGVGFNVTVDRTAGGPPFPLATGGTCNACPLVGIPAMGEWGLIILALLLLSFATVAMVRRQTAVAGFGNVSAQGSGIPFDRAPFAKMLACVMTGLAAVFAVAVSAFGYEMTAADVPGSLLAGPVFAYLLHLLLSDKTRR